MKICRTLALGLILGVCLHSTSIFAQSGLPNSRLGLKDSAPKIGELAPTFTLKSLDGESETELEAFRGEKPVVLIFGSYTWPPFLSQVGVIERMYQKYKDIAEFRIVYICEAHAADSEWPMSEDIYTHTSFSERCDAAKKLEEDGALNVPIVIDEMDDAVNAMYNALPDRVVVVRKDGRVAICSRPGPMGLRPAIKETKKWLKELQETGAEPALPVDESQKPSKKKSVKT